MALKFGVLCNLLSSLEDITLRDPPLLPRDRKGLLRSETAGWFKSHRHAIDGLDARSTVALLSSFFPERRTDRVYGIQTATLVRTLCRCLGLSSAKAKDLEAYRSPGHGDLGECVERALLGGGPPALPVVTLEEVDHVLLCIAQQNPFSDPSIQRPPDSSATWLNNLGNLVRRVHPREAKWLVRLILKDFAPVCLDEGVILRSIHFLLPDLLRFQQNFDAAVEKLRGPLKSYPSCPDCQSGPLLRKMVLSSLRPAIGVKVARPEFCKGRSVDHCLQILNRQRWLVERKYDGEYCEMHIDLSKGDDWLKIFSKSGKDSTNDRKALKHTLRRCFGIGTDRCRIQTQCILLGEMVVFSDRDRHIMEFHKIRKHVSRSGVVLGADKDSQPQDHEHLMIIFFDLLLLDDSVLMNKPLEERKARLNGLYKKKEGRAITAESKVLDFADPTSKRRLMSHFAASIAARHEGLVLKPCGVPYFAFASLQAERCPPVIKLKKDYVDGLGDEADFAVIGASYNAQEAMKSSAQDLRWTHFHLGCLLNKTEVARFHVRPRFRVVATIAQNHCIPLPILLKSNELARLMADPCGTGNAPTEFDIDAESGFRIDAVFRTPFVFEVLGSSFDKPSNSDYYMLRFPRVRKLHEDRTWRDCVSFDELQDMAKQALSSPISQESQENLRWMEKVERSCKRKFARMSCESTPQSRTTTTPPSKRITTPLSKIVTILPSKDVTTPPSVLRKGKRSPISPLGVLGPIPNFNESPPGVRRQQRTEVAKVKAVHMERLGNGMPPTPPPSSPMTYKDPPSSVLGKRQRTHMESPRKRSQHLQRPGADALSVQANKDENTDPAQTPEQADLLRSGPMPTISTAPTPNMPIHPIRMPPLPLLVRALTPEPGTCNLAQHTTAGLHTTCFLSSSSIYLGPSCTPYLPPNAASTTTRDLRTHGATVVTDLAFWDRDAGAHAPLTATVSESQAYAGQQKVALVDARRPGAVRRLVGALMALNDGRFRERVAVYDVLVLGACCGGVDGEGLAEEEWARGKSGLVSMFLLGVVAFDDAAGASVLLSAEEVLGVGELEGPEEVANGG